MDHPKFAVFRRRLFTILCVLSLLLSFAMVALWVRSYFHSDRLWYRSNTAAHRFTTMLASVEGCMELVQHVKRFDESDGPLPIGFERYSQPSGDLLHSLRYVYAWGHNWRGFGYLHATNSLVRLTIVDLRFPHWFLALLFAIFPALYVRAALLSRSRRRAGLCRVCGYDLRATPERCPGCGKSIN